jgi:hypothetical protein
MIPARYQLSSLFTYYLAFFMKLTLFLTTIVLIKTSTNTTLLYLLLIGQCFEYSCSNLLGRFPVGYDRNNFHVMVPIIYVIFILSNVFDLALSIEGILSNVSTEFTILCGLIIARLTASILGFITLIIVTNCDDEARKSLQTDGRRLVQYLECINPQL